MLCRKDQFTFLGQPDPAMRQALLRFSSLIRPKYLQTKALTQFTRVTISPNSAADVEILRLPELRQEYDIVAIQPGSTDMLAMVSLI